MHKSALTGTEDMHCSAAELPGDIRYGIGFEIWLILILCLKLMWKRSSDDSCNGVKQQAKAYWHGSKPPCLIVGIMPNNVVTN